MFGEEMIKIILEFTDDDGQRTYSYKLLIEEKFL